MKEFNTRLDRELLRGLRPSNRISRGSSFLEKAQGVEASVRGLEVYEYVADPFINRPTLDWPYPKVRRLSDSLLLFTKDAFYNVDPITWESQAIVAESLDGEPYSISAEGKNWHIAETQGTWFAVNGKDAAFRVRGDETVSLVDYPIQSGCYHKGRFVFGGFDPEYGWGDLAPVVNAISQDLTPEGLGDNYVLWSSIGGGDFPLALLDNSRTQIDEDRLLELIDRNEFGFMPIPYIGRILKMVPLDNNIFVYGSEGIARLFFADGDYGYERIFNRGIAGREAVSGNDREHYFVTNAGELHIVRENQTFTFLDYKDYLAPLVQEDIHVSLSQDEDRVYISGESACYVLTRIGDYRALTEYPHSVSSIIQGFSNDVGIISPEHFEDIDIITPSFDFGLRAAKTITAVELGVTTEARPKVRVHFKLSTTAPWRQTPYFTTNLEGVAYPRVHGVDFRVEILSSDIFTFALDYINVKWQSDDKRTIRGAMASFSSDDAA